MSVETYNTRPKSLNRYTLDFLDCYGIDKTVVCYYTKINCHGVLKKHYVSLDSINLTPKDTTSKTNGWGGMNQEVWKLFLENEQKWLDNITILNAQTDKQRYYLALACDTSKVACIDVDHVSAQTDSFVKLLDNAKCPRFKSFTKGLNKYFIKIKNMPPNTKGNHVLLTHEKEAALELQCGQWTIMGFDSHIINSDQPIPEYDFEDLQDQYPSLVNRPERCMSQNQPPPNSKITKEELDNMLSQLPLTVFATYQHPTEKYDHCWLNMCYMLKSWNEKDGLDLLHKYSRNIPDKYDEFEVDSAFHNQRDDGMYYNFFVNMANHHHIPFKQVEEGNRPPLLSNDIALLSNEAEADNPLDRMNKEIEMILKSTTTFKLQQGCYKKTLMNVMKNLADSEEQYQLYKHYLEKYCKVKFDDISRATLFKEWKKVKHIVKYDIKYLRKQSVYEPLLELETKDYLDVRKLYEKRIYKILSPSVMYADIEDNGEVNFYSTKSIKEKLLHVSCIDSVDDKKKSFGEMYLRDERISTVYKVDFNLKTNERIYYDEHGRRVLNLFNGFYAENLPLLTPKMASPVTIQQLEEVKTFVKDRLCNRDEANYDYLMKWLAYIVQQRQKTKVIVVLKGDEGCGKGLFINWIGNMIFGTKYYCGTAKLEYLVGKFNGMSMNKVFFNANEISRSATMPSNDLIKEIVDNHTLVIDRKGLEPVEMVNNINIIVSTNNEIPFKIPFKERRFFAMETQSPMLNPDEAIYFGEKIFGILPHNRNEDLIRLFYNYLLTMDLSDFNCITSRPFTEFYKEMVSTSIPHELLFLHYYRYENIHEKEKEIFNTEACKSGLVQSTVFYNSYVEWWTHFHNIQNSKPLTHTSFGRRLMKIKGVYRNAGKNCNSYYFNPVILNETFKEYLLPVEDHINLLINPNLPTTNDNDIPTADSLKNVI